MIHNIHPHRRAGEAVATPVRVSVPGGGPEGFMTHDERTRANRETAIRFVERLGEGVLDDALLAPDPHWWVPGLGVVAREQFAGFVSGFHALCDAPPEMKITGVTADGDRVAVEARCDARLRDGARYHNTYHFLLEFEDGKVKLAKEYNDTRHSTETVGALLLRASRSPDGDGRTPRD
jgi:ketosteroid isomerase-like protein